MATNNKLFCVHGGVRIVLKGRETSDPTPFIITHRFIVDAPNCDSAKRAVEAYCQRQVAGYITGLRQGKGAAALSFTCPDAQMYPLWPDEVRRDFQFYDLQQLPGMEYVL
jgi:hypothetical protein